MHAANPVLLAVATVPPWPLINGYAIRVFHLLRELSEHWRIVLIAPSSATALPEALRSRLQAYVQVAMGARWTSLPSQFETVPLERATAASVEEWKPRAVLLWHGAEFLGFTRRFPPAVADRIDCLALAAWRSRHHARTKREWFSALNTLRAHAFYERRVVRGLSATVVVGEDDARALRRIAHRQTIHTIPNGVAAPLELMESEEWGGEGSTPTVAFTGVLDYPPNVDAGCEFAGSVWPDIRAAVPGARFVIAGRQPLERVRALAAQDGVEVRADVPDMYRVLREAWVVVAPMVCGSGIKNKVLEAWAAARPVAMTSLATNGLTLPPDARDLVASDIQRLGGVVVDLLRHAERRRRLGLAMREQVLRSHQWGNAAANLSALLHTVST
ncbi:MAG TPA: glycosyltransferase family 4 protein [Gemmatimonadales bacterium]|nr:glycosyltransferase family 4 protein [Gemmatimonadales bacterium]